MSRQHNSANNAVSLFPFLAVLICAMGALIFLLIVTTRRIRHNAIVKAERESSARIAVQEHVTGTKPVLKQEPQAVAKPEVIDLNNKVHEAISKLRLELATAQQQADSLKQSLVAAKSMVSKSQAAILSTELRLKEHQAAEQKLAELNRTISIKRQTIQEQAALYRRNIEAHQQQTATASSKYQFVPFEGSSGTTRRPILIECTSESIKFVQENVTLYPNDLNGFTAEYNPLLTGSRALIEHYSKVDRAKSQVVEQPEPYILLIVRPDGSRAYYIARALLKALNQPFGYELVQSEWELETDQADSEAKSVCISAISRVIQQREKLLVALRSNSGTDASEQLTLRRGGENFEVVDERRDVLDREGHLLERSQQEFQKTDSNAIPESNFLARYKNSTSRSGDKSTETPGAGAQSHGMSHKSNSQLAGVTNPFEPYTANDTTPSNSLSRSGGNRTPGAITSRRSDDNAHSRPTTTGAPEQQGLTANMPHRGEGEPRLYPEDIPLPDQADSVFAPRSNAMNNGGKSSRYGSQSELPIGNAEVQGSGVHSSQQEASLTAGNPTGTSENGQTGEGQSAASASGVQAGSQPASLAAGSGTPSPFLESGVHSSRSSTTNPFTKRSWGKASSRSGIGFEREIKIVVTPTVITVSNDYQIPVGQGESRDQLLNAVISSLDKTVSSWGDPPVNFYWMPTAAFQVAPGGNQHLERLLGDLQRLGLASRVEYALNETTPQPAVRAPVTTGVPAGTRR